MPINESLGAEELFSSMVELLAKTDEDHNVNQNVDEAVTRSRGRLDLKHGKGHYSV